MSKLFLCPSRSIQLALLSSLGVIVGAIELTELRPAAAELVCPKNSWVYQGQLSLAREALKNAEVQRNRMRTLEAAGAISRSKLDQAETDYQIRLLQVEALLQSGSTSATDSLTTRSAQLAAADAEVEVAQTKRDRVRALFEQGAISRSYMQNTELAYQAAVKQRDVLKNSGASRLVQPQPPRACDRPPSAPTIDDAQIQRTGAPPSKRKN